MMNRSIPTLRAWRAGLLLAVLALIGATAVPASAQAPVNGCLAYPADASAVIYCVALSQDTSELFELDDAGDVRQLTYLGGRIHSADISSDGRTITFHATANSQTDPQVYRIARSGPRARSVMLGGNVIELGTRTVMLNGSPITIDGARAERLTEDGGNSFPTFTPGGDRIAFFSDRLGSTSLWSMRADGSDEREMLVAGLN